MKKNIQRNIDTAKVVNKTPYVAIQSDLFGGLPEHHTMRSPRDISE